MTTAAPRVDVNEGFDGMMSRYLGGAIVRALEDPDVTEVYVNPQDGTVRLDTRSQGRVASAARIEAHRVEMFLNVVAASLNLTLDPARPRLEAELPAAFGGSRLQGFVPPVASAPAFNIRKRAGRVYTLEEYVTAGLLTATQRMTLRHAVAARRNILVVGGTNSGKTTLANALLKEITDLYPRERIVILEDTVELQCSSDDCLALRTTLDVSLSDLVRSTLRASPNRIIVGEVRGREALDLLDAWATGHPGGVATLHGSSVEGALLRLDRLAQRANVPSQRQLIAEAIQTVTVIQGGNGGRRVTDVAEVTGVGPDGSFVLRRLDSAGD